MSIIENSVWPNGLKKDDEGYTTYYRMGTNKLDISTITWPTGDKLVSPYVYQNGRLVGFCDTKALTVSGNTTVNLPYTHIEANFAAISEGTLTVNAPNAIVKKISWSINDGDNSDGDGDDDVIVTFKYKGCKTIADVKAVDPNYLTTDIVNGTWNERLDDLTDSSSMFRNNSDIIVFDADLYSLTNGGRMFESCPNLTSFTGNLSSLTNGGSMFKNCSKLATINCSSLSSLKNADSMFYGCSKLTSYNYGNLPYLTSAKSMFKSCSNLATFNCTNLSSLKNADNMFYGCKKINTFNADLSSLTYGYWTFYGCSKLVTFNSSLSSLTNGFYMFMNCKLDTTSVQKIADTIKDVTELTNGTNAAKDVYKHIHVGITNSTPNSNEITSFNTIATKGWTVYVNGSAYTPTSASSVMTLDELGNEVETPLPFYAKPVPTVEDIAEYVDENGDFYSIMGGQFIYGDDLSTYGMFTCEEDAAANMRLTKIERTR